MNMITTPRDEDGDIYILDSPPPPPPQTSAHLGESESTKFVPSQPFQRTIMTPNKSFPSSEFFRNTQTTNTATHDNNPHFNNHMDKVLTKNRANSEKTQKTPVIDFTKDDPDLLGTSTGSFTHMNSPVNELQPRVYDVDNESFVDAPISANANLSSLSSTSPSLSASASSSSSFVPLSTTTKQEHDEALALQQNLSRINQKFKKYDDLRAVNTTKSKVLQIKISKKMAKIKEYQREMDSIPPSNDSTRNQEIRAHFDAKIKFEEEKLKTNQQKLETTNKNLGLIQNGLNTLINQKTDFKLKLDKLKSGLNHTPSEMAALKNNTNNLNNLSVNADQQKRAAQEQLLQHHLKLNNLPSDQYSDAIKQQEQQKMPNSYSPYASYIASTAEKLKKLVENKNKLNQMLLQLTRMFQNKMIPTGLYNSRRENIVKNINLLNKEEASNKRLFRQLQAFESGYERMNSTNNANQPVLHNRNIPNYMRQYNSEKKEEDEAQMQEYTESLGINPTAFGGVYSAEERESIRSFLEEFKTRETEIEGETMTPEELTVNLMKHQRLGLHWLLKMEDSVKKGGLLADEMGLGKTLQMVSLVLCNRSEDKDCKTTVVVAPVSLLDTWQGEFETKVKDSANISTLMFHDKTKVKSFRELSKYDVVFVSYHTLRSELTKTWPRRVAANGVYVDRNGEDRVVPNNGMDLETLLSLKEPGEYYSPFFTMDSKFFRIILDEGQQIKNKSSKVSKTCCTLLAKYRWILTGTPIQNNMSDLYSLVRFLRIPPYNKEAYFQKEISNPLSLKKDNNSSSSNSRVAAMNKVQVLLAGIMLRRTKNTQIDGKPLLELPPKTVSEEQCSLVDAELEFYQDLETKNKKIAEKLLKRHAKGNYSSILTLLLRLRQACLHSELVLIGEAKAEQARVASGRDFDKDWVRLFELCQDIPQSVVSRTNNFVETDMICERCTNPMELSLASVFPSCGHMICFECLKAYKEDCSERELTRYNNAGQLVFPCHICQTEQVEDSVMSFKFYDQVVNQNYSLRELRDEFDVEQHAAKEKLKEGYEIDFENLEPSPKVQQCLDLIQKIADNDPTEKVLIFSQFTTFFDILQHFVGKNLGMQSLRYDGTMNVRAKTAVLKEFQRDPNTNILLISMGAGNAGLTLTSANHVILADPFWNPFVEEQAMGRAHRISQTKEVHVHRLLVRSSVEDRIVELQNKKQELVGAALDNKKITEISRLGSRELGFLFGLNQLS
ncbi:ATP-dependent helicase ULS1 [Hanseniaspora osmophila]|uniref:ATP-dependent helicase ULS1 n=1 Tax=Hanseniaspora osmophila TaxID=56408 RepID=A0A1E5RDM0_9ASCO|nr:ATP-dependent helicase ULS1 [Hanseniaspora osmophila]